MSDMSFKTIDTWSGRSNFKYSGSVMKGTTIKYGAEYRYPLNVTSGQYAALIDHFRGQNVNPGTSREPPRGSVGEWLQEHVTATAISSYV